MYGPHTGVGGRCGDERGYVPWGTVGVRGIEFSAEVFVRVMMGVIVAGDARHVGEVESAL